MKNTEFKATVRTIEPEEGFWLTEKQAPEYIESTIFSKKVYLAVNDSADRWVEISDAEKQAIEKEIEAKRKAKEEAERNK